ncbi:50S ribosomal protein L13 [Halovivax gelatinilyticus]|uniref:50S ribosomal protein L13 n=1 Tax=Halovivax gelatinilyticus TaxID=2961597 RepID=UPI0020CA4F88|nr:50S ribosomal protein L13 [Halovivax gelatinilyticus]
MSVAEFDADLVVDARDCILGRVSSQVAQRALDGERIAIVNAEGAVITGDKEDVFETYRTRAQLGSDRGPNYPKRPDMILKRAVRGMLPYKTQRGRDAFEGVRVYVGNPYDGDDDREPEVLDGTSLDRLSNIRFVHLGEVSEQLGANVTW